MLMLGLAGMLIVFSEAAAAGAREGLTLFAEGVLPCLFPFMVCGHYISAAGLPRPLRNGRFARLLYSFVMAIICAVCGTPAGALICAEEHVEGMDGTRASLLCAALNQTGPLFVIGLLGGRMLGAEGLWPVLAAAHYLPCVIAACVVGSHGNGSGSRDGPEPLRLFADSLSGAVSAVLRVGGTIVFFRVLISVFEASGLLSGTDAAVRAALAGAFEMTNGLGMLTSVLPPTRLCCSGCAAMLTFGGACIFMQSKLFFPGLRALPYFALKTALAAVSFGIAYLLYPLAGGVAEAGAFPAGAGLWRRAGTAAGMLVCVAFSFAASLLYARLAVRRRNI